MNDAISIQTMTRAIGATPRTPQLDAKLDDLKKTIRLILDEDGEMYRATSSASRDAFADLASRI
ncbi:hypothetical protein H7X69_00245, partial [Candidatus Saccharibacteria bacterium]|nr:hypothetical protein [Candidatus Saccharibacteria bacterium]